VLLACLAGCQNRQTPVPARPGPPTLKVSYRKSQIPTQGMVVNLNNPSTSESLKALVVFVRAKDEKEDRSYRLDRPIKPLDSMQVGWNELGGWKLKAGDKLRIQFEGYEGEVECEVPN
jgi:hypothetical protein